MLETKARTQAQVLLKKKQFSKNSFQARSQKRKKRKGQHKNFSVDLQKKMPASKIFLGAPQKFNNAKNIAVF